MRRPRLSILCLLMLAGATAQAQGSSGAPSSAAPSRAPVRAVDAAPVAAPPKTGTCDYGMEKSADTDGRCCWPGQVFADGRCVGIPTVCPAFYALDEESESCRLQACPGGQVRASNGLNCCWPGQAWSTTQSMCKGRPRCPPPFTASGETCVGDGAPPTSGGPTGDMVRIPGGTFTMGSMTGDADEKPTRLVTLSGYEIDRTEVTVDAYQQCVQAGRCTTPNTGGSCNWGSSGRGSHPVNCVDWDQSVAFCAWKGKRLPTEAEWEYAARGNDGRTYPWGNMEPSAQLCWKASSTCAVGSYPSGASPFGVQDMAGNVWEWVSDWYVSPYPSNNQANLRGPDAGSGRVIRGGGWSNRSPAVVRAAVRLRYDPGRRSFDLGFRCARGAGP